MILSDVVDDASLYDVFVFGGFILVEAGVFF